ncbi:MauE/DoxX family redox-associated membrane protein [Pedobacter deserti]|uniref:MauE/DoxX family redox-associated membrane protein n=1 Tax=Pedobacter deserti TaxID=2817382 RepID=UPI00210C6F6C|nr:MauE/DoxX family redox-associated membrane protein [Pedobacter sp. SYSU D00382]
MERQKIKWLAYWFSIAMITLLFCYTAASKLMDYEKFVFQMQLSPFLIVKEFANVWAWLVPTVEVIVVFALLTDRWRRLGLVTTILLLSIFQIYIGLMLLSKAQLPCTCGGVLSILGWDAHLIFNFAFIFLAISGLVLDGPKNRIPTLYQNILRVNRYN